MNWKLKLKWWEGNEKGEVRIQSIASGGGLTLLRLLLLVFSFVSWIQMWEELVLVFTQG